MTKIHVTGNAGAGKTTLAYEIGTALGIPIFNLDTIVWQAGWVKTPSDVRTVNEKILVNKPEWVIEGISQTVRDAADILIFLDVSRTVACVRCAKRNWKFLFKSRPELPENCPEILIVPQLIKIIWRFKAHVRPKILSDISERPTGSFIITDESSLEKAYKYLGMND